jgi:hypothetical protein
VAAEASGQRRSNQTRPGRHLLAPRAEGTGRRRETIRSLAALKATPPSVAQECQQAECRNCGDEQRSDQAFFGRE